MDFGFDSRDYPTEEELAFEEGFYIDDDGHWVQIEDEEALLPEMGEDFEEDDEEYPCIEEDPNVRYTNDIEYVHREGFRVDDDGNWIP